MRTRNPLPSKSTLICALLCTFFFSALVLPIAPVVRAEKVPEIMWSYKTGGSILSLAVISDVTGDGKPDVVVGSADYNVYLFNGATGKKVWNYLTRSEVSIVTPIDDISGDGLPDVIAASDNVLYALAGSSGTKIWATNLNAKVQFVVITENRDVLVGVGRSLSETWESDIIKFDGMSGTLISKYPYTIGRVWWMYGEVYIFAVMADFTNDNIPDLIVGTNHRGGGNQIYSVHLFLLDGENEGIIWDKNIDWKQSLYWGEHVLMYNLLVTSDISGDGVPDILQVVQNFVVARSGATGNIIWSFKTTEGALISNLPDISSDGRPDVAITNGNDITAVDGSTGKELWRIPVGNVFSMAPTSSNIVAGAAKNMYLIDLFSMKIDWAYPTGASVKKVCFIDDNTKDKPDVIAGLDDGFVYRIKSVAKSQNSITCIPSQTSALPGQNITISGFVSPVRAGAILTLSYARPDNSNITKTVISKPDGSYIDNFVPEQTGTWQVKTIFTGDNEYLSAESSVVFITVTRAQTLLSIEPSSFNITTENSITLTAKLTFDNEPISGKPLTWSATTGIIEPQGVLTDSEGKITASYTPPAREATLDVNVSFMGDAQYEGCSSSSSGTVRAAPQAQILMSIEPSSFDVEAGDSITLVAKLTCDNAPLSGKPITWTATEGSINPQGILTDSEGKITAIYTAPAGEAAIRVTASFGSEAQYGRCSSSSSGTVRVISSESGDPTSTWPLEVPPYFLVAVAVLAIAAVALVVTLRRYRGNVSNIRTNEGRHRFRFNLETGALEEDAE